MARQLIKIFSHNDLDGFGAPQVLLSVQPFMFPDTEFEVTNIGAGQIDAALDHWFQNPQLSNYSDVYMMDMTPDSEHTFEELNQHFANHWLVFDHHETEQEARQKYAANSVEAADPDILPSAASIAWDWVKKQSTFNKLPEGQKAELSELVELIRAYDTWDWENDPDLPASEKEGADELNELFWFYPKARSQQFISQVFSKGWTVYHEENELLIKTITERRADYLKHHLRDALTAEIDGHQFGIVYASDYNSQIAHQLLADNPELEAALVVGPTSVSLRSNDKMDVAKFAEKYYQGGGHANAAGGRLPINPVQVGEHAVLDHLKADVAASKTKPDEDQQSTLADNLDPDVAAKMAKLFKKDN